MSRIIQSIDCKCDHKYTQLSVIDNNLLSKINFVIIHNDDYGTENIIITTSDEVFGFGTNYCGRLGFGTTTKVDTPTKIPELSAIKVIKVRFGLQFMLALTKSGDIYTSGYEDYNYSVLGNGRNSGTYTKPQKINFNLIIIDIKCCNTRSILLTQTNQIYWFGCRQFDYYHTNTPTLLNNFNNEKVIQTSTGNDHILALTHTEKLYSWGLNKYGELGHNSTSDVPKQIMSNESVKQISCGYNHSLILTSNGVIYSCGNNKCGQLGTGNTTNEKRPKCLTSVSEKFVEIFCVQNMSIGLTENHLFYIWGQTKQNNILSPLKTNINSFQEAIDFHCQNINTYKSLSRSDIFIKRPLKRVIETMNKAFNNPKNSDLKFKVKRKENNEFDYIYGHKWFIEENSDHFKTMFANEWIESQTNEIKIIDYSYEAYYQYIKCLYTECIETEEIEVLTELLSITEQYLDENTKLSCVEKIKPLTTLLNVCTLYSCALKYRSKELEDYCFEIMSKNMKSIVESEDYKRMDSNDFKHFSTKYFQQK